MTGNEDLIVIGNIIAEETREYGKVNDNLIDTMHRVVYALVEKGFTVRYSVSDRYKEEFQLTTNILELKEGNNGGFGHSVNENNEALLTMAVSFLGIRTILAVPFKDIEMVFVVGNNGTGIELGSLMATVTWERYNNMFHGLESPSEKEVPEGRVVSLADYRPK